MDKSTVETGTVAATVTIEPLTNLDKYWQDPGKLLEWNCLFVIPPWLCTWWRHFGKVTDIQLCVVREDSLIIGIAPLLIGQSSARLVSNTELMDYSDFIIASSKEKKFFSALFEYLGRQDIRRLDMPRVRADSGTISFLQAYAPEGWEVSFAPVDVFYEMDLPDTWEGYLDSLAAKERHETRRKLRRLESAGHVGLRVVHDRDKVPDAMDSFVELFRSNREEKMRFMTGDVELFFRALATAAADAGILKLFFLDLDGVPVAATMCFDYSSTVHLYNNGYDRRFSHLSVGLISKVFSIRESIKFGRAKFNFLRGSETYKGRLGGRPVSLLHCEVTGR